MALQASSYSSGGGDGKEQQRQGWQVAAPLAAIELETTMTRKAMPTPQKGFVPAPRCDMLLNVGSWTSAPA